ncbi:MAG: hypothetical protein Kow0020_05800 [Wenzhouxiangellaceae bacterium]
MLYKTRNDALRTHLQWILSVLLCFPAVAAVAAGTVGSGTPGSCTEAAFDAALTGGGAVDFDCGPAPVSIVLTSTKNISSDTTIDGGGLVTLDGNGGSFYLFNLIGNANFSVSNLVLRNAGGAISGNTGDITIESCTISDHSGSGNAAINASGTLEIFDSLITRNTYTGSGPGAGIKSTAGTLTIIDSEISDNVQQNGGGAGVFIGGDAEIWNTLFIGNDGGVSPDGALRNDGTTRIFNSTFTGNIAASGGGAIWNTGSLEIYNSTIAGNAGHAITGTGAVGLVNTIIAGNDLNCSGSIVDVGGNLQFGGSQPTSCGATMPVADPLLDVLADNGGPTRTMALLPGSPAIDAGINVLCPPVDQRGVTRPQGPACDIGAFELEAGTGTLPPPAVVPVLSPWGLAMLIAMLAGFGMLWVHRRRAFPQAPD